MKDISVEELIVKCGVGWNDFKAELLRRFEVLEKELKATKLAHAVEKQMMQDNFTQCKTVGEYLKTENDNLRCCGNCKHYYDNGMQTYCFFKKKAKGKRPNKYCGEWITDGLTREEREGK